MEEINSLTSFASLKNNKFIGTLPEKFINSSIRFNGRNNIIYLGPNVMFRNTKINFKGDNSIVFLNPSKHEYKLNVDLQYNNFFYVGNNNYFNGILNVILSEEKNVFIGDNGLFSFDIWIRVADPHLIYDISTHSRINYSKSVFLGDHVWVGQNVIILKGSQVGSGSIIAAQSLVAGVKIDSNSIYGGSPAKRIKSDIFWDGSCVHSWKKRTNQKV